MDSNLKSTQLQFDFFFFFTKSEKFVSMISRVHLNLKQALDINCFIEALLKSFPNIGYMWIGMQTALLFL